MVRYVFFFIVVISTLSCDICFFQEEVEPPKKAPPVIEHLIKIDFKLLNWKFMNFSMKFKEDTYIFTIKRILRERHGKIEGLKLCFHAFTEANEIHDEMLTLRDCGLKGFPVGAAETEEDKTQEENAIPIVQLFYDFRPDTPGDPVILHFR